jgi:hypothetical protein
VQPGGKKKTIFVVFLSGSFRKKKSFKKLPTNEF